MEQARDQIRKQLRKDWDENGDGKVCDGEKEKARTRLRDMIRQTRVKRFEDADLDGDGALTLTEPWVDSEFGQLPGIANKLADDPENPLVEAIFNRLDVDGSGGVTLAEFTDAVNQCDQARDGSGDGSGGGGSGGGSGGGN